MQDRTLAWGDSPEGFARIIDKSGNRLLVRQDQIGQIDFSFCQEDRVQVHDDCAYQGRGSIRLRRLANGHTAVIRLYLHGGALRRITGQSFFTWPPRPFRELAITEELRRRGLRTVEIYAACVSRPRGPFYRGWLITRQLENAEDLWAALKSCLTERMDLDQILRAAAESIAAMHREGVYHTDLNLKNILVRPDRTGLAGYIIDFDKAKVFLGRLPAPLAARNLKRLQRSVRKLDPTRQVFSEPAWDQFLSFYHAACSS